MTETKVEKETQHEMRELAKAFATSRGWRPEVPLRNWFGANPRHYESWLQLKARLENPELLPPPGHPNRPRGAEGFKRFFLLNSGVAEMADGGLRDFVHQNSILYNLACKYADYWQNKPLQWRP